MKIARIDFKSKTIKQLFAGDRLYYIPAFQRRYQWTKSEIKDFLTDIDKAQISGGYFLGPVLTYEDEKDDDLFHIVDGQQRLTTLILYFSTYRKYIKDLGFNKSDIDFVEGLILPTISRGNKPKRILKTSHPMGDKFLEDLITDPDNFDPDSEEYLTTPELTNAYRYILDYLNDQKLRSASDNNKFFDFTQKKVFVTEMVADNFTQAFIIFERMNDRGIDLTEADKIKHLLLSNIANQGQEVFDEESPSLNQDWEEVTDRIKKTDTNMDDFLRYFFMAFYWDDQYKSKSAILPWLKEENNTTSIKFIFNPKVLLKELKKYSKYFEKIRDGKDNLGEFNESIQSLKSNYRSNRQHYPILLAASDLDDPIEYKKVAKLIDALIVIFSWSEAQWNDLEKALPDLCRPLRNNDFKTFEKEIRALIKKHKKEAQEKMINFEKLDDFEVNKNSLAKHLMHKVEYQLQAFCKTTYERTSKDSIEHILEKNNLKIQEISKPENEELEEYIKIRHRLGNQTIWMSTPNKANSQKTPSEKISREIIEKSIGGGDSESHKEFEIIEGAFQGTKHMTTNLIINGTLDSDAKSFRTIQKKYSITGPEKLTNEKWTDKNVLNREKYIFHILSQALLIHIDPHDEGYEIYDFVEWDDFEWSNKDPEKRTYSFKNIKLLKD
jgi:uncharacterized protein with ParB-like and HNH nuclease domain